MTPDIYCQLAAIRDRSRSRRLWAKRRKAWAARGKLALVILACVAGIALAVPAGLIFGAAFS